MTNSAFYAVFFANICTALASIVFAASGMMPASAALGRINHVKSLPTLPATEHPQTPKDDGAEFKDASIPYGGAALPALSGVSFRAEPGQAAALVGPSGGLPFFCMDASHFPAARWSFTGLHVVLPKA